MAEYVTDFSEYADDAQPTDWTARWVTANNTWAVRSKANTQGGKVLENTGTIDGRHLLSMDSVDSDAARANVEILARVRTSSTLDEQFRLVVRGSGSAGAENGYSLVFNTTGNLFRIHRFLAGASAVIGTSFGYVEQADTWHYLRFRANGSDLFAKIWLEGYEEPTDWTVAASDTNITGVGWVGIGNLESTGTRDIDWIKVVTGGGSPTIDFDPGTEVRLYQEKALVASLENPEARLYQIKGLAASLDNPELRLYQMKLLVAIPYGYVAGGSQQPRMVLAF